jgi:hypothetical protein
MNVTFLTPLKLEKLEGDRWSLVEPFVVEFDTDLLEDYALRNKDADLLELYRIPAFAGRLLTVPAGFNNDLASVPRLPFAYWLAGGTAEKAGVVHDYLYSVKAPRDLADEVFMACMRAEGVPGWRRSLMWGAVRAFGGSYYQEREPHQDVPDTPA